MQDLHTKYRPATFDDVVGQADVVASLRTVLRQKSTHAFVFTGPSGVGKTTLARIVAMELGCEARNLLEIDAATHTGIDAWRAICDGLRYAPLGGSRVKCVIVDEAHSLSKSAWQSLLKDVEEPPDFVFWFFCTTEGSKIPKTILTRCARYELGPVRVDDLHDLLDTVCKAEGGGPPEAVRAMIARSVGGSPREALTALATCWDVTSTKTAGVLLKAAGESKDIITLMRLLLKGTTWPQVLPVLQELVGQNAESLRMVAQDYLTKVLLGSKSEDRACAVLAMLDCFATPYPPSTSLAPFVLSVADAVFGD